MLESGNKKTAQKCSAPLGYLKKRGLSLPGLTL